MIVEDENGNDIDLRDLDNDREPEPPDDEPERLDLDKLQIAHDVYRRDTDEGNGPQAQTYLLDAVPALIAELSAARAELERLSALPTREEYAITDGGHPAEASVIWPGSSEDALRLADDPGRTPWVRTLTVHPWVGLSTEPPF